MVDSGEGRRGRPWSSTLDGTRPTDDELRSLTCRLTDGAIALQCGVSRQAVAYWRETATPPIVRGGKHRPKRLTHKELLPWSVGAEHSQDRLARALRGISTLRQGRELRSELQSLTRELLELVDDGWVVDYDRESGFRLVRFDPQLDAPGAVIRRPQAPPA